MQHASAFTAFASPVVATTMSFYPPQRSWHAHVYMKPEKIPTPHSIADILSFAVNFRQCPPGDRATTSPGGGDTATESDTRMQRHQHCDETGSDGSVRSAHSDDELGHPTAVVVTLKGKHQAELTYSARV